MVTTPKVLDLFSGGPNLQAHSACGRGGKFKVLDLFSGIGGFSLGLERTGGFETVAFCEIKPFCRRVLAKHWPSVPCYDDVRTLTGERLSTDGISVDVICGGFPCVDVSSAGKKGGIEAERSGLWGEIARLIGEIRPKYVLVENVANLLAGERGTWFSRVLGDLAALGYDAEWHCIPASAVGAPHARDRVWIIAYPAQGMRDGVLLCGRINDEGLAETYKRVWAVYRARRSRNAPESNFRRLRANDGLSPRLGEIAAYGNAVVPQIPELIGRAILDAFCLAQT